MPQDENIIPEADIQTEEVQTPSISFSPVSSTEELSEIEGKQGIVEIQKGEEDAVIDDKITATEPEEEEEEEYETIELDENTAWEFLKKSKGLEVDNLDVLLTSKEQKKYAPAMEKFNEFIEKTGNTNYNDFLETQKDWSTESEDNRLKSYLKLSNPALTSKEVDHLYNKRYNTAELDEDIDEDEIIERGINIKTDLTKADAFLEQRKKEFEAVGGSDEYIPIEYREAKQQLENQTKQEEQFQAQREVFRNDFISKTESLFNNDFEGFKIQLGDKDTGFEDLSIRPENLKEIKEFQSDSNNLINEFFDPETGSIKDPKAYHEAMYMAKNYKTVMNYAYQKGMAKQLELSDKISKNIQPDNIRQIPQMGNSGITLTVEK